MTKKLRTSSDRGKFSIQKAIERDADQYVEFLKKHYEDRFQTEQDPGWQKNNLEYDLRTTDWIADKVKRSPRYAQNLYAALCNNEFQQLDVVEILKDRYWSCSWRYAGGIVADICEQGDYLDWYCSGIRSGSYYEEENQELQSHGCVNEGCITDEIRSDLLKLGWVPGENQDEN